MNSPIRDIEKFTTWLKKSHALAERSARDVVSRLRRAACIVPLDTSCDTVDLLHELSKKEEFKILAATVRSQLRRAIRLYREFISVGVDCQ
jgi:DNA (cytosine-5)-methyltransferase 1